MSESEYPYEVFLWEANGKEPLPIKWLLQQTGHSLESPVKVEEIDTFFQSATQEQDWHGSPEKEVVNRHRQLVQALTETLGDAHAYRVGTIDVDVYIVGKTASGQLAGLATKIVET